jgi:hypothetical protein
MSFNRSASQLVNYLLNREIRDKIILSANQRVSSLVNQ